MTKKIDDIKAFENRFWTDDDINARIQKSNKYSHLLRRDNDEEAAPRIPTQSEAAANRLAELNRKNREAERERIRKVQLEERQQKNLARKRELEARKKREAEERQRAEEEKNKNLLSVDDDLFGDGASSRASSVPKEGTPKPDGEVKKKEKTERKGLPTFRKPKMDDDIIASMDIGLDIEI